MRRIGILTAGGDTPALNATIHGAVTQANARQIEVYGFIKGFSSLFNPRVPHVHLNPLFQTIPELDPTLGGTVLGASRDYVDHDDAAAINQITDRLHRLGIEGIICVGGDGTLNAMQALSERIPAVLAPKTIDNDLGLNFPNEPNEWLRGNEATPGTPPPPNATEEGGYWYTRSESRSRFDLGQMVNYVTPGYATAVYVSAAGVQRIRTTAESHRRIAIVEVMGRHSGYIALGSMYGQPDLLLVPESRINVDMLVSRIQEVYDLQKHAVIVCGEGVLDENGMELGAEHASTDPAGNKILTGASESLREVLVRRLGDTYFTQQAAERERAGGHLHAEDRAHPAGRTADPVRPLLRRPAGRPRRRPAAEREGERGGYSAVERAERVPPGRGVRQRFPRQVGADPRPQNAPGPVRPAAAPPLSGGHRLPDPDLHQGAGVRRP